MARSCGSIGVKTMVKFLAENGVDTTGFAPEDPAWRQKNRGTIKSLYLSRKAALPGVSSVPTVPDVSSSVMEGAGA